LALIGATGFKRLGLAVAVGVLAGVGGLVAASLLVPAEAVRNAIKAEIRAVTGFDPIIRGDVAVSLFPWGTVSFDNVTLGDERSGETAFAAERLTARMRLLPLLAGQIEAADVSLVRPHIAVTYEPDGRSNWSGLVETLARNFRPGGNRADRLMSFSEIRITDGTVVVRDDSHGIAETLSGVEMSLAWPSISKSFGATGRLVWRGEPLDASITLTDFFAALQGERTGLKVRLNGSPFKVAFDGHMSRVPTLKMDGTVSTGTASLRHAFAWAGYRPLDIGGFGRFALKAQMTMVGSSVLLAGVNAELDGNTAEGVLSFATDGRASMQGTLDAGDIDLTPYLSTVQLMRASERDWSEVPIALDGLTGLDLDLRLSAARMTVGHARLGRTAIAASVHNGQVTVTFGESHAFGGLLKGTLALAKSPTGVDVKSQLHFADIDLEPGLGELIGVRRLQGKGSLAFSIEASGNSVLALTRTLNGQATLSARQGALAGFNVEELLKRLERRPLSGSGEFRSGHTPYEQLMVVLKFTQGTVSVEQVHLDGAAVRLAMAGSASIPARNVDLTGTARLVTPTVTDSGSPFELPFMVTGPWDGPDIRPDIQTLIQRSQATAPLLDSIKDRKTREAVQSAIDRLTGASAAPTDQSPPAAVTPALAAPGASTPAPLDPAPAKR
jgi:AsmA protein